METSDFSIRNGLEQFRDVILVGLFSRFVSWCSLRLLWVWRRCRLDLGVLVMSPLGGCAAAGVSVGFGRATAFPPDCFAVLS